MLLSRCIVLHSQADLFEMVLAANSSRAFAGRLDSRQEQCHEDANDRNHHKQLDERESAPAATVRLLNPFQRPFHLNLQAAKNGTKNKSNKITEGSGTKAPFISPLH